MALTSAQRWARWYAQPAHREARLAKQTEYRLKDKNLHRMYRITAAERQRMLDEQDNRCKICGRGFEPYQADLKHKPLRLWLFPCVDHSHECSNQANHWHGQIDKNGCPECIRGMVCPDCNRIVIPFLDRFPDRRTAVEQAYMTDRPILRYRGETRTSLA